MKINEIYLGDCLELMKDIPNGTIDMILCDLPYGTTACKWDVIIPFDKLWEQYERIIKTNGAILLFGQEPFSIKFMILNIKV
jgi:predicted methyltransferase